MTKYFNHKANVPSRRTIPREAWRNHGFTSRPV